MQSLALDYCLFRWLLPNVASQPWSGIAFPCELMVGNAREEMVTAGRQFFGPLFSLERNIRLFLLVRESLEQSAEAGAHRVLSGQCDEDEAKAHLAKLSKRQRIWFGEPLE